MSTPSSTTRGSPGLCSARPRRPPSHGRHGRTLGPSITRRCHHSRVTRHVSSPSSRLRGRALAEPRRTVAGPYDVGLSALPYARSSALVRTARRTGDRTRTYEVRTYGCQMNVHDSERLSGLLEDAGYVRARPTASRPTSSCSTPARCARTPTTSSTATSATSRRRRRRGPGMQIAVGGCLAQKDRATITRQGAVGRRGVRHPQHRVAAGAARAGAGAGGGAGRDPRVARGVPLDAADQARVGLRRVGLDLGRVQQHLHVLHRPGAARQGEGPPARRHPGRDPGAGRRGRQRGHAARPERQHLRRRSSATGRRSPSCCGPAARSRGWIGCGSPLRIPPSSPTT